MIAHSVPLIKFIGAMTAEVITCVCVFAVISIRRTVLLVTAKSGLNSCKMRVEAAFDSWKGSKNHKEQGDRYFVPLVIMETLGRRTCPLVPQSDGVWIRRPGSARKEVNFLMLLAIRVRVDNEFRVLGRYFRCGLTAGMLYGIHP